MEVPIEPPMKMNVENRADAGNSRDQAIHDADGQARRCIRYRVLGRGDDAAAPGSARIEIGAAENLGSALCGIA